MRVLRGLGVSAAVLATGLMASACGPDETGSTTVASTAPTVRAGAITAAGSPGVAGTPAAGASAKCRTADLAADYRPGTKTTANTQVEVVVQFKNTGSDSCYLYGWPGVDLVGTVNGQAHTWSLGRGDRDKPSQVVIAPKSAAQFAIEYGADDGTLGNQVMKIDKVVITPPDETHQTSLPWNFQNVTLQDGATHPSTFVNAVVTGGN